jgi:hypothetical protein
VKYRFIFASVLSVLAFTKAVNAQSGSGTMAVTATVQGSINLTFSTDPSGLAVTGTTTSTAALPLGNINMYGGAVPTNVTKTVNGVDSFDLSTPFDIRVDLANSPSTTYTLKATLSTADSTKTWLVGAVDISSGTVATITSTGAYATAVPYTLKLTVPAAAAAGAVNNTINFTATGN